MCPAGTYKAYDLYTFYLGHIFSPRGYVRLLYHRYEIIKQMCRTRPDIFENENSMK